MLAALAAADAGHVDEDRFNENWMVAQVDCGVALSAGELTLTPPEHSVTLASAKLTPTWTYQDCESR